MLGVGFAGLDSEADQRAARVIPAASCPEHASANGISELMLRNGNPEPALLDGLFVQRTFLSIFTIRRCAVIRSAAVSCHSVMCYPFRSEALEAAKRKPMLGVKRREFIIH